MQLSVVVPCFNEESSCIELVRRITSVCKTTGLSWELVLVDDGSTDRTWLAIQSAITADPNHIVGVALARNYGHQLALSAGLKVCKGDRILILDADLQDPPEYLPAMMKVMDDGADVVYGQRVKRKGETLFKKVSASLFYRVLQAMTDIPIPRDSGDFRLVTRRVVDILNDMPEGHRFIRGMISWIGFRQSAFLYVREERFAGETKYPFRKMKRLAIDAITGFSVKPLKIASYLGILCGLMAVASIGYVFAEWMMGNTVPGWASLLSVILMLGSVQIIVLGVIGEYLGRLYSESKGRPNFIIREVVGGAGQQSADPASIAPIPNHIRYSA